MGGGDKLNIFVAHKIKSLKDQPLIFTDAGGVQIGTDAGNDVSIKGRACRKGRHNLCKE